MAHTLEQKCSVAVQGVIDDASVSGLNLYLEHHQNMALPACIVRVGGGDEVVPNSGIMRLDVSVEINGTSTGPDPETNHATKAEAVRVALMVDTIITGDVSTAGLNDVSDFTAMNFSHSNTAHSIDEEGTFSTEFSFECVCYGKD